MSSDWLNGDLLGFDLETTGVNLFEDRPVSFALVSYRGGAKIGSSYQLVNPGIPIPPAATAIHHITDRMVQADGMQLDQAIACCCEALCEASAENVPVVGMVLRFDFTIVGNLDQMRGHCGLQAPQWHGPVLDVSLIDKRLDKWRKGRRTLPDLCTEYGVDFGIDDAHDALSDATASVEVLLALARRYPVLGHTDLATITSRQAELHKENLVDLNEYRLRRGQTPIAESEISDSWPVATRN